MTVTMTIETQDAEIKAREPLIKSVIMVALDNYAARTANDIDSKPWNDIIEMIRENIDIKVVWEK